MRRRIRKMNLDNIDEVVEIISNSSLTCTMLPEPVNLDEVRFTLSFYL